MLVSRICAGLFVGLLGCFALAVLWDWFLASGILDYWPVIGLGYVLITADRALLGLLFRG